MAQDLTNEQQFGLSLEEFAATATVNGYSVDFQDCGPEVTAIIAGNSLNSGQDITVDVKIQESADASTWTDITGATSTQVATPVSFNEVFTTFARAQRYCRLVVTLTGASNDIDIVGWLSARKVSY